MNTAASSGRNVEADAAAALMEPLTDLVLRAGAAIMAVNRSSLAIEGKADGSPVTEADFAADRIIGDGLEQLIGDIPALSEERAHPVSLPYRGSFFLIDPLDGTKEFVAGRDEFTVNLALVTNGTPLLGIIGAPALGLVWRGLVGRGAERLRIEGTSTAAAEPIHTRPLPKPGDPWIAAVSRSHGDARSEAFIASRPDAVRERLGSAGQVRPRGRGQGRYLSPPCPDIGMGRRRRPCHCHRGRRQGHRRQRRCLAIRGKRGRLYHAGGHRLGRSFGC